MAKVYVVTSGEESDYCIDHIFSNREAAERCCATWDWEEYWDKPRIEEYELEDGENTKAIRVYKAMSFDMRYSYYNHTIRVVDIEMTYGIKPFVEIINLKEKSTLRNGKNVELYYGILPVNKTIESYEQAEKIVYDHLAKWKKENQCVN